MSEISELIDRFEYASRDLYGSETKEEHKIDRENFDEARTALTEAITALQSRAERAEKELAETGKLLDKAQRDVDAWRALSAENKVYGMLWMEKANNLKAQLVELQFIARRLYLSNASKSTCTMYEQYLDRARLSQSAGNDTRNDDTP